MAKNKTGFILFVLTSIIIAIVAIYLRSFLIIKPYKGSGNILIIEDKIFGNIGYGDNNNHHNPFIFKKERVLVSSNIIKQEIDPYLHWDEKSEKVTLTTKDKTIRLKTDSLTALVNSKPVEINIPATKVSGHLYIPVEFLADFFGIQIKKFPEVNRVVIDFKKEKRKIGYPLKPVGLKISPSVLSPVYDFAEKGETLYIYGVMENWYRVRTADGIFGYVKKDALEVKEMTISTTPTDANYEKLWQPTKGKINLVWNYIHQKTPDMTGTPKIKGLDVISPTWFSLADENGTIDNKADKNYVKWAHDNGYKVWALFDNGFNPEITSIVLNDTEKREKIIKQLLVYADLYEFDGINIDFENVFYKDRDMLTQFVRELTPILHEQNLVVSIDVTVKSQSLNWSLCYDRKSLGQIVDYIALMAYDEHWATSPVSGPVASIGWVEKGIQSLLEEVESTKVLLGLPFYTREWEETPANDKSNLKVTSKALSMSDAKKKIKENKADMVWSSDSGTYFAVYKKGDKTYKIWLEDEKSIELKASLVEKYNLAGTAAWRLGLEEKEVWDVLYKKLKPEKL
ncbi:MAG: hypothetical protein PWQ82_1045 [Thermosediminibacterales bacterium]|nr:hypothetical protein [Thermosediminibacterales bacterium]MDK2836711.1 hypothetical protein [Thermosediminibacterales bacterium]